MHDSSTSYPNSLIDSANPTVEPQYVSITLLLRGSAVVCAAKIPPACILNIGPYISSYDGRPACGARIGACYNTNNIIKRHKQYHKTAQCLFSQPTKKTYT